MRCLLCLLLILGVFALNALHATAARADDWDEDRVVRSRDKDKDEEQRADPEETRRDAYERASDPDRSGAQDDPRAHDHDRDGDDDRDDNSDSKAKDKSKSKNKSKGKGKEADAENKDGEVRSDAGELGGYFGLGEDMEGAKVDYVAGQGYVVTYPDGTTRRLRGNDANLRGTHSIDEREGRDQRSGYSDEERAEREAAKKDGGDIGKGTVGERPEGSDDGGASSEEQVWGPLWGVPEKAEALKDYPGELNPYVDENGKILDPTQRDLAVNVRDEQEADAEDHDHHHDHDHEDDASADEDADDKPEPKINRKDPDEW
jgi:hypothetical protein